MKGKRANTRESPYIINVSSILNKLYKSSINQLFDDN